MILLSYNCRGLASQPKKLALRDLIRTYNPEILMLQETLGKGEDIIALLSKMLPGWLFQALDANGRSGGVVTSYKAGNLREIFAWGFENSLVLELYSKEL